MARARLHRGAWHRLILATALVLLPLRAALAGEVSVAAPANFTEAAKEIGALFGQVTGHKAVFSFGATGQLYTQITQGAPFEVFLAADQERPQKAVEEGYAEPDSRFTYATGRLVLFSKDPNLITGETTLKDAGFTRLAIANPATAPYGAAAIEVMQALGVYDALSDRVVQANNIAQTYQFVDTGNADMGFIALSQVAGHKSGSRWVVPETLHSVIAQDAVLLKQGEANEAARSFLVFLKSEAARAVKEKYGYGAGD